MPAAPRQQLRSRKETLQATVHQKASHLTQRAKQHGFSSGDIDTAILSALERESPPSPVWKRVAHIVGISCRGAVIGAALFLLLYVLVNLHKPTRRYFGQLAFNSSYQVSRAVRLLTLPLARQFDLSGLYNAECAIPNPFFKPDISLDCYPCSNVDEVPVLKETRNADLMTPFISQDPNVRKFTYEEMSVWYSANHKTFSMARYDHVQSSNPFISTLADVFMEERKAEDIEQTSFSLEWRSGSPGSIRLVRNLCGKPSFIRPDSEVQPEMFILLDSPSSHAHFAPKPSISGHTWLSQAHGSREFSLSPTEPCQNRCSEVVVTLRGGEVLLFSTLYWRLASFPSGSDISISCMGSFSVT